MAIDRFLRPTVLIDGVTQVFLQDASITFDPKLNPVELFTGLGGFTPGAKTITLSVTSAVRISGPEFDPAASMEQGLVHEFQFVYGVKTIVSEGQITGGSITGSVNDSTKIQFEFMGTFNKPK